MANILENYYSGNADSFFRQNYHSLDHTEFEEAQATNLPSVNRSVLVCSAANSQPGKMSEENFSATGSSYLSSAMATPETTDQVQTSESTVVTSSSRGAEFYFQVAVLVIGVMGAAANALIIYAMVVSNQHRKQLLIFNQNKI